MICARVTILQLSTEDITEDLLAASWGIALDNGGRGNGMRATVVELEEGGEEGGGDGGAWTADGESVGIKLATGVEDLGHVAAKDFGRWEVKVFIWGGRGTALAMTKW